MSSHDQDNPDPAFQSTQWSLVLVAGHKSSPDSRHALAELCQRYWYPVYAYVRRRVADVHEAQDLTQQFFTTLLEKDYLAVADPERGRFRSFLITACKHFLSKEWDKTRAQKRGGGKQPLPLDFASGEARYHLEPHHDDTPERLYDQQWVLTLLEQVMNHLTEEWIQAGKEDQFAKLKQFLIATPNATTYDTIATQLGTTKAAVKMTVHRMRKRYRELLRGEIAQTVADPAEIDDEIQRLFALLAS